MTRGLTFSDAFWDTDIIGTFGWDTLCKRMRDGRKVCSEVAHYLKDRVKAEADYSKALSNLARKVDVKDETGVLGESWKAVKTQTEKIATVHEEASSQFNKLYEELNQFSDEQTKQKKQTEDNVKKYIQSKKNEYNKTMSCKKAYHDKCKDFDNAEETLRTVRSSVTTKKNELEKAESKLNKAKDTRENADLAYKSAIETLESTRQTWEMETEKGYNHFEELETTRIDFLRDLLWQITNTDSRACVGHDDCSESVRTILENCDIATDLQDYVSNNKSGSKRPDPVLYENYYDGKSSAPTRPQLPAPKTTMARLPPKPPSPTRPPPRPNHSDEGHYASVESTASGNAYSQSKRTLLKIVRSHVNPSSASELQVRIGDIVEYIGATNISGMIKVKYNRRMGVIPMECAKVYEPSA